MSENIEVLRAQLAEAQARAKIAEAEAEHAKAEAASAALAAAEALATAQVRSNSDAEAGPRANGSVPAAANSSAEVSDIANGYAFPDPSLTLGTLLDAGVPVPTVPIRLPLAMINRHLLVAGATGTGKTRTLQLLAEGLSRAGTSVVLCDVKGDLTGLAESGIPSEAMNARAAALGQEWQPSEFPVELLARSGSESAYPRTAVRVPLSSFGPVLLARALSLNTTQEQTLTLIFSWADQRGLALVDLADMRAVIGYLTSSEGKDELALLGGVSRATAGVILRALSTLEAQGGADFFGEPGFDTADLLRSCNDRGVISLLDVSDIFDHPGITSALVMWILADLFSDLPEVGDPEKPRLVLFFDEAHVLFTGATKEFTRHVVQIVRLIRSKGVGIVFVTQTPTDLPSDVLAQIGSRIQHSLRASTPSDQKKLRQTVDTFPSTAFDLADVLTSLGTGEAIVTVLGPDGRPTPVAPTKIWAPESLMGPASEATLRSLHDSSPIASRYGEPVNPESAEEFLAAQREATAALTAQQEAQAAAEKEAERLRIAAEREARKAQEKARRAEEKAAERRSRTLDAALSSALRSASSQLGREITRTIFGTRRR